MFVKKMACTSFGNLAEVVKKYGLFYQKDFCELALVQKALIFLHKEINLNRLEILGVVSNGDYWQFAFLKNHIFRKCKNNYAIDNLDSIYNFMVSYLEKMLKIVNSSS